MSDQDLIARLKRYAEGLQPIPSHNVCIGLFEQAATALEHAAAREREREAERRRDFEAGWAAHLWQWNARTGDTEEVETAYARYQQQAHTPAIETPEEAYQRGLHDGNLGRS